MASNQWPHFWRFAHFMPTMHEFMPSTEWERTTVPARCTAMPFEWVRDDWMHESPNEWHKLEFHPSHSNLSFKFYDTLSLAADSRLWINKELDHILLICKKRIFAFTLSDTFRVIRRFFILLFWAGTTFLCITRYVPRNGRVSREFFFFSFVKSLENETSTLYRTMKIMSAINTEINDSFSRDRKTNHTDGALNW